jgi:hypothetical protein
MLYTHINAAPSSAPTSGVKDIDTSAEKSVSRSGKRARVMEEVDKENR